MDDLGDQQIEVIDAAFSKLRTDRQLRSEVQLKEPPPILFSIEDLQNIRKDFLKVCNEGELMDYDQFRTSLGLLGAEDFFAREGCLLSLISMETSTWALRSMVGIWILSSMALLHRKVCSGGA